MSLEREFDRIDGDGSDCAPPYHAALWSRLASREVPDATWQIMVSVGDVATFHISRRPHRGFLRLKQSGSIRVKRGVLAEALRNGRSAQHLSKTQRLNEVAGSWRLNAKILHRTLTLVVEHKPFFGRTRSTVFHCSEEEQRRLFELMEI